MRSEGRLFVSNLLCERTTPPMTLNDQIINAVEHWQELLATQPTDLTSTFATIEQAAWTLAQRIAQLTLSHQIQQIGSGYDRSSRPCPCAHKQRFERYAHKTVRTLFGEVSYRRAYYRCRHCGGSCFPLDEQLRQGEGTLSP